MQQPHLTTYADIAEVRTVTGATACNQLLSDGWVLLGKSVGDQLRHHQNVTMRQDTSQAHLELLHT